MVSYAATFPKLATRSWKADSPGVFQFLRIIYFLFKTPLCLLFASLLLQISQFLVRSLYLPRPRVKSLKCHKFVPCNSSVSLNKNTEPQPPLWLEAEENNVIQVPKMKIESSVVDWCDFWGWPLAVVRRTADRESKCFVTALMMSEEMTHFRSHNNRLILSSETGLCIKLYHPEWLIKKLWDMTPLLVCNFYYSALMTSKNPAILTEGYRSIPCSSGLYFIFSWTGYSCISLWHKRRLATDLGFLWWPK